MFANTMFVFSTFAISRQSYGNQPAYLFYFETKQNVDGSVAETFHKEKTQIPRFKMP